MRYIRGINKRYRFKYSVECIKIHFQTQNKKISPSKKRMSYNRYYMSK